MRVQLGGFLIFPTGFILETFLTERHGEFVMRQCIGRHGANCHPELRDRAIEITGIQQTSAGICGEGSGLQVGLLLGFFCAGFALGYSRL